MNEQIADTTDDAQKQNRFTKHITKSNLKIAALTGVAIGGGLWLKSKLNGSVDGSVNVNVETDSSDSTD